MNRSARDDEAREAAAITLAEYDRMADAYRLGTADHDVSQNIAALLDAIEGGRLTRSSISAAGRAGTCAPSRPSATT